MKSEVIEETLKIPSDILLDVLGIIVREQLKHEVIQIINSRSLIVLVVSYNTTETKVRKSISLIQNLISDYWHYRSSENETINWREI